MDSTRDPFAVAALVGAGTLVGHELGYLADTSAGSGHGYFTLIAPLALVGVVIAAWASAVSIMRKGTGRVPSVGSLAAAQTILYAAFEVGERTIGAAESPLFSLPVLLGLAAQPLVAWLAVSVLRLTADALAAFVAATAPPAAVAVIDRLQFTQLWPTLAVGSSAPARAPPLMF